MKRVIPALILPILVVVALYGSAGGQVKAADLEASGVQQISVRGSESSPFEANRLLVLVNTRVTPAILAQISKYGAVHGVIARYRSVVVTPKGSQARAAIQGLSFVSNVEIDQPRFLTDVGTWNLDIIDVTDVEETGSAGDPDRREVAETGRGVHIAVIDSGMIRNWSDFIAEDRIATDMARAFLGGGARVQPAENEDEFNTSNPTHLWERDTSSHGTAITSQITGFKAGAQLVDGVAPGANVIPLKVFPNGQADTFSSRIIAAIDYVIKLKQQGRIERAVINLSLGGASPVELERRAIRDAIAAGVIVVASAGNEGEAGMDWPAAYPEVISVGAVGWTNQFGPVRLKARTWTSGSPRMLATIRT